MKTTIVDRTNYIALTNNLAEEFAARSVSHDAEGSFVHDNYKDLKKHKYFSAGIPIELGGSGLSHRELCDIIRIIGNACGSTALSLSMHQHIIAASVWKYQHKNKGAEMLRNVVAHELILISTGARDWLGSNGSLKKSNGGYLFSGTKHFASQSSGGEVVVTSGVYNAGNNNAEVFHFAVPMTTPGVSVLENWDVMGMRGTGSNSILFEDVFIPESAISLKRPQNEFHGVWDVVLTVALPLIMSAYMGVAERAMEIAIEKGRKYQRNQDHISTMVGRMNNSLLSARTEWNAMQAITNDYDFTPGERLTIDMLSHKTNVGDNTKRTVEYAMEAIGGQSFYRRNILERLFRDIQASPFHPLPKWEQYAFTGERILKG